MRQSPRLDVEEADSPIKRLLDSHRETIPRFHDIDAGRKLRVEPKELRLERQTKVPSWRVCSDFAVTWPSC